MRFKRRILQLELKNRSATGLGNLHESSFIRFASFAERTKNFSDLDVLSADNLEELDSIFFTMKPNSKLGNVKLDDLPESQLEAYLAELKTIRRYGKTFDFIQEIEIEKRRRNFAA